MAQAQTISTGPVSCAILAGGSLKCWGYNSQGNLGQGDTQQRGNSANQMGDNLLAIDLIGGSLPVELTSFTATLDGTAAMLRWTTASETNNSGFDIEHRTGADSFQSVGFAPGHGTTLEATRYAHSIEGLTPGTHTFRLKQIDFDGAFDYSPEVELTLDADGLALALYGIPATDAIRGSLSVPSAQQVRVTLFDMLGRKVMMQDDVQGVFTLDVSAFASGSYVLRVTAGTASITRTVVIAR